MKQLSFVVLFFSLTATLPLRASIWQDTSGVAVPIRLQYWHDLIGKQQEAALQLNGKVKGEVNVSDDKTVNLQVTDALIRQVNEMRTEIEGSDLEFRKQVIYLSGLYNMLRVYNYERRFGMIDAALAPELVENFRSMMAADRSGKSIAPYVEQVSYDVGEINVQVFNQNYGYRVARYILFRKYADLHPNEVLPKLRTIYADFVNEPYTDTLIAKVAHLYPEQVYNYATSSTPLGSKVRGNNDPLVKAIVKIGQSNYAIRLLSFVEYIANGTYTIAELQKVAADDDAFYKLVVKTKIDMDKRQLEGAHPIGMKAMQYNIKTRALKYIRLVNDLHESPDRVRFGSVDKFTPQEIYYVLINGQEELYTSSYVGLFKRMMERMKPPKGDEFLMSVIFDRFRKFLTMAAAYNTLDPFLRSMDQQNANLLMQKFVSDLQYSEGLEDAVDVADAFGSIKDSSLLRYLQQEVAQNYRQMMSEGNERGKVIYGLLSSLFNTRESSGKDKEWSNAMASKLNLPPIDYIPFANLETEGRVYQQVFFYGDKDGFESYNSFLTSFRNGNWKITNSKYWTTLASVKGKPTTIFAKKPQSDADEDEKGMTELRNYLEAKNIHPTVYIHRGHSYHVNATIAQLQSTAKLVILGSCGGYNSLAGVLNVAPDAQIISSKQTGSMHVNEPIIRTIEDVIRSGKNLDWIDMWNKLGAQFKSSPSYYELFQDYIPPHKNLGAIFIKAYKKLMKEDVPVDTAEEAAGGRDQE
ncbi:hypothetical protein [Compostibacter hankyongensis]|uniref:Uncharacterized protein n=1 Tax=Compostibacter hankyongensis TaxID=1007089 RepID=A0ABP8FEQ3_9BACT